MTNIIEIEYVDHGVNGEYGFFGKVVARSIVAGMTATEIANEIAEMKKIVGEHCAARAVEVVGAVAGQA
jgi:hypothetical protein